MIKIMITCRNRLSMTKKCIKALQKHSQIPHQIYVYDNLTNYKLDEHFEYFRDLYKNGVIHQITFNTKESTFNAFSKAVSINQFGSLHIMDPNKNSYDFLLMLDNDIIVTPDWDIKVKRAWKDIKKRKMNDIKMISQLPGGIKNKKSIGKVGEIEAKIGDLGGGGFNSIRPNFFEDVGFLPINELVGHNKKSDQLYWRLMSKSNNGKPYILGLDTKLCIHCGNIGGSICNNLTRIRDEKEALEKIKFGEAEERIENMCFDDFYKMIINDNFLINDW